MCVSNLALSRDDRRSAGGAGEAWLFGIADRRRWFSVRLMPCRTMEDVIVVMVNTFAHITAAKKLEAELRAEKARIKNKG